MNLSVIESCSSEALLLVISLRVLSKFWGIYVASCCSDCSFSRRTIVLGRIEHSCSKHGSAIQMDFRDWSHWCWHPVQSSTVASRHHYDFIFCSKPITRSRFVHMKYFWKCKHYTKYFWNCRNTCESNEELVEGNSSSQIGQGELARLFYSELTKLVGDFFSWYF